MQRYHIYTFKKGEGMLQSTTLQYAADPVTAMASVLAMNLAHWVSGCLQDKNGLQQTIVAQDTQTGRRLCSLFLTKGEGVAVHLSSDHDMGKLFEMTGFDLGSRSHNTVIIGYFHPMQSALSLDPHYMAAAMVAVHHLTTATPRHESLQHNLVTMHYRHPSIEKDIQVHKITQHFNTLPQAFAQLCTMDVAQFSPAAMRQATGAYYYAAHVRTQNSLASMDVHPQNAATLVLRPNMTLHALEDLTGFDLTAFPGYHKRSQLLPMASIGKEQPGLLQPHPAMAALQRSLGQKDLLPAATPEMEWKYQLSTTQTFPPSKGTQHIMTDQFHYIHPQQALGDMLTTAFTKDVKGLPNGQPICQLLSPKGDELATVKVVHGQINGGQPHEGAFVLHTDPVLTNALDGLLPGSGTERDINLALLFNGRMTFTNEGLLLAQNLVQAVNTQRHMAQNLQLNLPGASDRSTGKYVVQTHYKVLDQPSLAKGMDTIEQQYYFDQLPAAFAQLQEIDSSLFNREWVQAGNLPAVATAITLFRNHETIPIAVRTIRYPFPQEKACTAVIVASGSITEKERAQITKLQQTDRAKALHIDNRAVSQLFGYRRYLGYRTPEPQRKPVISKQNGLK